VGAVRVKKTRPIKNPEPRFDSIETEKALAETPTSIPPMFLLCSEVAEALGLNQSEWAMSSRRNRTINMPAPYLKRLWLDPTRIADRKAYPFCLPFLHDDFELSLDRPITIIVGENGTGKSTLLEGIAVLAGYDEAGGGKGYRPVDHSNALEVMGGELSKALRAAWLPKITNGWFFRAESFFSIARYLDEAAREPLSGPPPDFLSHSHGEGFLRFFEERCQRQGIFIFDEPESALSPARQMEFLKLMRRMEESTICQIVMATHSPMLMAYPNARLLRLSKYGLEPVTVEQTDHYKVMREFCNDPAGFVEGVMAE
jgi:predicted ATPase